MATVEEVAEASLEGLGDVEVWQVDFHGAGELVPRPTPLQAPARRVVDREENRFPDVRLLARAAWHYYRGLRAWHDAGAADLRIPRGFIVARGGTCEYGSLRPLPVAAGLALLAGLRDGLSAAASVVAEGRP